MQELIRFSSRCRFLVRDPLGYSLINKLKKVQNLSLIHILFCRECWWLSSRQSDSRWCVRLPVMIILRLPIWQRLVPVSYTHLDVYKRQRQNGIILMMKVWSSIKLIRIVRFQKASCGWSAVICSIQTPRCGCLTACWSCIPITAAVITLHLQPML